MAFSMSLTEAKEALSRAKNSMAKVREKAEEAIGHGIEVAEVGGTAFGFGYANAKWGDETGELKAFGIPVDLGAGIALTGVAMFGGFGRYAEHGVNVGAGAIAAYSYRTGYQLGEASNDTASNSQARRMAGPSKQPRASMPAAQSHVTAGEWDSQGQQYTVYEHQGA
jgi:hypothetical protein